MPWLIIIVIILGMAVGFLIFFMIKQVLQPKRISTLSDMIKAGKTSQAIRMAKLLLTKDPRSSEAHYFLGLAYLAESKYELALMEMKTVNQLGIFSGFLKEPEFRKKMAELYQRFEQDEEALKEYLVLVKLEPSEPEHFYNTGLIFEERGKPDHAVKFYRKCLELAPNHSNSHLRLGLLFFRAKRAMEAKQELEMALKLNPDNANASYYLGKLLKDSQDWQGALSAFERAVKDPELKVKALIERGACYMSANNFERAMSELERAIKLSTDEGSNDILFARYFLATCYENNRMIEKAIGEWEKIYAKKPSFKDVAEKLSAFQDLRVDDRIKDFITSSKQQFSSLCQKITNSMGLTVQDITEIPNGLKIISTENDSEKWRNTKKMPKIMLFLRVSNMIEEEVLRPYVDELRKLGGNRIMVITNSGFTRTAMGFAETRPFDLLGKDHLQEMLKKVEL